MTGASDCELILELTNSVKGTVRYEIGISQFFNQAGPTAFIDRVALVLGIDPTRVRVSQVTRGSSIVHFDVDAGLQYSAVNASQYDEVLAELEVIKAKLQQGIEDGSLNILNSTILESSLVLSTKNYQFSSDSAQKSIIIVAVGISVALVALGVGIYITYRKKKLQKKRQQVASINFIRPKQIGIVSGSDLNSYNQIDKCSSAVSPSIQHLKDKNSKDGDDENKDDHEISSRPFQFNPENSKHDSNEDKNSDELESPLPGDKHDIFNKKELYLGSKILLHADIPGIDFKSMNFDKKNPSTNPEIQEEDL